MGEGQMNTRQYLQTCDSWNGVLGGAVDISHEACREESGCGEERPWPRCAPQ